MAFSLLMGGFLAFLVGPSQARAGFLSSILGSEVQADTKKEGAKEFSINSQNIALLQANVISFPTTAKPKDEKQKEEVIDENKSISIVSENALMPATGPMVGALGGGDLFEAFSNEISVYVVRKGDTVEQVAGMFDISVDTVLSANDMKKGEKLKEGDVLLIMSFSGVEHTILKGQTLQGIANLYKVEIDEILLANDLDSDSKLVLGGKIVIPGATMLTETAKPKISGGSSLAKSGSSTVNKITKSVSGFFRNPVPGAIRTRGVKPGHQGVDLAAPTGTPIYAAASGRVLTAKTGWSGGFGNMAIIQHSNGTKTLYAHMSKVATSTGAEVSQGEVIGYVGNTGRSRGPHLHIEVLGGKNPF